MSSQADENDPEVQKNGFRAWAEEFTVPDGVLETFFKEKFDPTDTFTENAERWWSWFEQGALSAMERCPECGELANAAELSEEGGLETVRLKPCGHNVDLDESPADLVGR